MTLRLGQVRLPFRHRPEDIPAAAAKALGLNRADIQNWKIERRSVDARDKGDIRLVYTLRVEVGRPPTGKREKFAPGGAGGRGSDTGGKGAAGSGRGGSGGSGDGPVGGGQGGASVPVGGPGGGRRQDWEPWTPAAEFRLPAGKPWLDQRPVVVGSGPAGLFAALALARKGLCPLVLERGDSVDARMAAIEAFHGGGPLDPDSNVQFGEGGAGTFSDGKLTTQVNDTDGRATFVLRTFVEAGAPEDILWTNKPHIGTDLLVGVVRGIRKEIERLGGEVRFRAKVTDLVLEPSDSTGERRVAGVVVNNTELIHTRTAVLALGHSARDSFAMLRDRGLHLEKKPFAMGVRIEHPQSLVGQSQFGEAWDHPALPVADYKLASKTADGRGVYTFCMCPGGWVVNASSEAGMTACNGMSYHARSGPNANAAVLVTVGPEDFPGDDVLAGVEFQRHWERLAWEAGGRTGALPVQTFADFRAGVAGHKGSDDAPGPLGRVAPSIKGQWQPGRVDLCLPDFMAAGIVQGVEDFDRKLHGFALDDAVLTGVETRSSSPVRMVRGDSLEARGIGGLWPCGEGAGYAGGIMSAAMDGLRVAESVLRSCQGKNPGQGPG